MSGSSQSGRNVKWIDGLRGIASVIVVTTHICRATDPTLFFPSDNEESLPRLVQYPIVRLPFQGRISIALFALITGFVCALKPLRLSRSSSKESALTGIARSAFRRFPRLALPPFIATVIIWVLCQFGAFEIARATDSEWLANTSPVRALTISQAFSDLVFNQLSTWTNGRNIYDENFWTIMPLYKAACIVYILCFSTIWSKPRYRMMMTLAAWVYYYICQDASFGMQFTWGIFLADLSTHPSIIDFAQSHSWIRRILATLLIVSGLYVASYPEDHAEWVPWSTHMTSFLSYILPLDAPYPPFATAFGLQLISLGIIFSPSTREFLSHRFLLFLGRLSFAVYILHGTLIRTVLTWLLYGISLPVEIVGEDGEAIPADKIAMGSPWAEAFVVPMFFAALYFLAYWWTEHVEGWVARVTKRFEEYVFEEGEKGLLGNENITSAG